MLVRYFMSPKVISLSPEQTCLEALKCLKKHSIRRAPVLHDKQLVGMVGEMDLYRALPRNIMQAGEEDAETGIDKPVRHIMVTEIQVVTPNTHVEKAARLMLKYKIGGLPVMKDGQIEGIITESDIFKALWGILSFEASCRILLFDKEHNVSKVPNDYMELCHKHHCIVNTFISYAKPEGGHMHYLCVQGRGVEALIKDLWKCPCDIVLIEREEGRGKHSF